MTGSADQPAAQLRNLPARTEISDDTGNLDHQADGIAAALAAQTWAAIEPMVSVSPPHLTAAKIVSSQLCRDLAARKRANGTDSAA